MEQRMHVTARQREILTAIVESYIATGEPVGSGTLARAEGAGMSAATIRNEMAELAEAGLLEQPHTSAGRVPSARAFRLYVEGLSGGAGASGVARAGGRVLSGLSGLPGLSRAQMESQIDSSFAGLAGAHSLLERTSHVLATLSSGVGVAISAVAGADVLEHVHFSRLAERRVLAVVVTRSGMVRDRVLALDRDLSLRELETASNFLNEHFRGWNLERVRGELAARVERERSEYQRLVEAVQQLWARAVPDTTHAEQAVYVEGVANLVGLPDGNTRGDGSTRGNTGYDRARLRDMLAALEAKQRMVELLNAYIDAKQESVRVVFELEEQAPEMAGLVLIAAPARLAGETLGTVGVLGSKRLNYESTMNAVSYISQVFERMSRTDVPG